MIIIPMILTLLCQAPAPVPDSKSTGDERLEYMKASVQSYKMSSDDGRAHELVLRDEPVFRIGQQAGDLVDGAVFLWVDESGRPEVAAQVFLERTPRYPSGKWTHELASLSTAPLVAAREGRPRWMPRVGALAFRFVSGAPKPAPTPAARLRQMRAIADEFKAEDNFGNQGWESLRLLTTPIARYGKAGAVAEDGALFAFVEGTDPEVFLFIEERKGADGPEWQYALTPMTCYVVKAKRDGREIWTEHRDNSQPTGVLYGFQFWP